MGSPQDEPDRHPDEDQVVAVISTGFWTAETEVTLLLWRSVMGHAKDRFITSEPDHPMHDVNWDEAHTFCRTLTTTLHETDVLSPKWELSLPTDAQWEYACRAGSRTITAFGDSLSGAQAQIDGAFPIGDAAIVPRSGLTAQVGSFPPNAWGLRDMHGNVWEWCADWYTDQLPGGIDPCIKDVSKATLSISSQKPRRVLRGGGFIRGAGAWRSADRGYSKPTAQGAAVGFRVVCRKRAK